ncbi:MAG TPA: MerR family transcriptional regulator [Pseudonocardia sp.]
MSSFSPAEAAEHSGLSIDTLRYYEREGILPTVARTTGGRRTYSEDDLARLEFLRCLRESGMPIAKLRRYAELADDESTMRERAELLEEHFAATEEAIAALRSRQDRLRHKIEWYRGELGT